MCEKGETSLGFPTVVGGSVLKEKEIREDGGWEGLGGERSCWHPESETLVGRVGIEMGSRQLARYGAQERSLGWDRPLEVISMWAVFQVSM